MGLLDGQDWQDEESIDEILLKNKIKEEEVKNRKLVGYKQSALEWTIGSVVFALGQVFLWILFIWWPFLVPKPALDPILLFLAFSFLCLPFLLFTIPAVYAWYEFFKLRKGVRSKQSLF